MHTVFCGEMMNNQKAADLLFFAGFALSVLQIWLPAYYITGDGPCHLYNAQILHDLWAHKNIAFYSRFYSEVYQPNPNWMSHLSLALLLFMVNGVVAEKILLTCYVVLFVSGFTVLLKRLNSDSPLWRLVVFVFIFHYVLAKGFYNFSFSVAFLFWLMATWLRYLENKKPGTAVLFFFLALLTFFAHPMAFAFGCIGCGALTVSYSLSAKKNRMKSMGSGLLVLAACLLPCGVLFTRFASSEGGQVHLHLSRYRILELPDLNCLVNVTGKEVLMVKIIFIVLAVLFVLAIVLKYRKGFAIHRFDGLLVTAFFAAFLYLWFPDKLFGGSLFIIRAQGIAAIFAVCCISYMLPPGKIKDVAGLLLFGFFIGLSIIRIGCREVASEGVGDILSASKYIKPYSIILPLDFSPDGKDVHGNVIADRNWLFSHAWQYMGTEKPLIFLDNYEANTGYFPLVWKEETNPYYHLCTNGAIEAQPPYATIGDYKNKTGVTIDYILMWCYDASWLKDEHFRKLYAEIKGGYRIVYTSPTGRTILLAKQ